MIYTEKHLHKSRDLCKQEETGFFFFNLTPIKRSYKNNELQQTCTANLKGWLLTQTSMLSIYPIRTLSKLLESLKISVFLTVICASKMILLCQIKMTAKIERHQKKNKHQIFMTGCFLLNIFSFTNNLFHFLDVTVTILICATKTIVLIAQAYWFG